MAKNNIIIVVIFLSIISLLQLHNNVDKEEYRIKYLFSIDECIQEYTRYKKKDNLSQNYIDYKKFLIVKNLEKLSIFKNGIKIVSIHFMPTHNIRNPIHVIALNQDIYNKTINRLCR